MLSEQQVAEEDVDTGNHNGKEHYGKTVFEIVPEAQGAFRLLAEACDYDIG